MNKQHSEHFRDEPLEPFVTEAMMTFFINNNFMRQIPNLQDGLNPVARRVIVGMYNLGLHRKKPLKSAKVVGEIMSTLHPHGDASIYSSIVGLAQEWSTPFILCEPEGSFGNQLTFADGAAAQRYTETKLTKFAYDAYLRDYDINYTINMDNYDNTIKEPMYLPARYPMALINGIFGIASGIKVSIPQYNITEVLESTIKMIDNPNMENIYLYPDSPTGCDIVDGDFKTISETGHGSFFQQSTFEIKDNVLYIKTFPYQVKVSNAIDGILDLVESGEIVGMKHITQSNDFSPYDGGFMGIKMTFKKEIDLQAVQQKLLKLPSIRKNQYVNFILIDDLEDNRYGLGQYIREWINARREYKQIQYTHKLLEAQEAIHKAQVLLMVIDGKNAEEALKVIRTSDNAEEYLQEKFKITSLQAKEITSMRLGSFSKKSISELKEKVKELKEKQKEYRENVTNNEYIDRIIKDELLEGIRKYGRERRSNIIDGNMETSVASEHRVIVTTNGYIKKTNAEVSKVGNVSENDAPLYMRNVKSDETLLLFDNKGYVYRLPVEDVPASELSSPGVPLSDFITSKVVRVLVAPNEGVVTEGMVTVTTLTKRGIIKSTDIMQYAGNRKKMVSIKLDDGDEVVDVEYVPIKDDLDIITYSKKGMGVRYNSAEVRPTGRSSKGVIGIDLEDNDEAIGLTTVMSDNSNVVCITEKGYVKRFSLKYFRSMRRTAKPLRIITLVRGDSIFEVFEQRKKKRVRVYTQSAQHDININDIDVTARMAKGKKVVPVPKGDNIITFS